MNKYDEALENIAFVSIIGEDGKFEDLVKDHESYKEDYTVLREAVEKAKSCDELLENFNYVDAELGGMVNEVKRLNHENKILTDGIKARKQELENENERLKEIINIQSEVIDKAGLNLTCSEYMRYESDRKIEIDGYKKTINTLVDGIKVVGLYCNEYGDIGFFVPSTDLTDGYFEPIMYHSYTEKYNDAKKMLEIVEEKK